MKSLIIKIVITCVIFTGWIPCIAASEKIPVFVSILPQKYFAEKIGGEHIDVSVMVEPGGNPHNYEPKPKQMAELSKSKIYFAVGVTFEDVWLERFAGVNKKMAIVHTEDGVEKIPMKAHHHEGEKDHVEKDHETKDPHIWLSPPLVKIQAGNIFKALTVADPEHSKDYEVNYNRFITELTDLDTEIRNMLAEKGKENQFIVFHPAWGYFANTYGLEQIPVETEGKTPKPAELGHLIKHAKEHGIKVIFVQPQFSSKSAEVIAKEIGGKIAFADPLAPDWSDNLRQMAEKFIKP